MVTDCCCRLVESWPLGGLNDTFVPPIAVGANQLRLPGEVWPTVTLQLYVPSVFGEQLVEVGSIFCGVTVIFGVGGGVQLHDTLRGATPAEPVKVIVPFLQAIPETDTCCCPSSPGAKVPFGGLMVAPTSLLAVQAMFPVELASSIRVKVHCADTPQVLESKLVGLTDQVGGTVV